MTAVRCTFKRDDVIRLLAVMTCTALVASAAAAAKVIETQTVTFRGNHVQARVTLATYPKAHGRHALYLFLRTRRPGAAAFREIALAALDDSRRTVRGALIRRRAEVEGGPGEGCVAAPRARQDAPAIPPGASRVAEADPAALVLQSRPLRRTPRRCIRSAADARLDGRVVERPRAGEVSPARCEGGRAPQRLRSQTVSADGAHGRRCRAAAHPLHTDHLPERRRSRAAAGIAGTNSHDAAAAPSSRRSMVAVGASLSGRGSAAL